ncbi:hypothetical protein ACQKII_18095 [Lysinibacillus sp. NPDC048646]|uniref:hypothetical protein n=1 Tax=Lysinibacillus sp. NPDC048646 TaxID=3390574 RepID=UPI003D079486
MFSKFMIFNIKLSPVYIFFALLLIFGILLFGEKETYVSFMVGIIPQLVFILFIPNVVYMIRHRKESGSFLALLSMILIIPLPFILVAIIMRILYL